MIAFDTNVFIYACDKLDQQWSYWDALLVAASMEAGVTRLYSEDLPGRQPPPGLEIVNPFA